MKNILSTSLFFILSLLSYGAEKPNIVFILADDLGYGDVHCLNVDRCKIATPCLDQLASEGLTLTNAHTTSSVCTPSRYGILTGRYNWRSTLQGGVLHGSSKPLISPDRLTVAKLLQKQGYSTGCVGKWHLGLVWPVEKGEINASKPVEGGPDTNGFGYYFIDNIPNWKPYCFIENNHIIGSLKGPVEKAVVPGWKEEEILPTLTTKACDFITAQAKTGDPFFLYYAMPSPHTPIAPSKEWKGKSILGPYGDYVMETDWAVGQVLATLEKCGVAKDTLVFFTSDNGCAPYVGVGPDQKKELIDIGLLKPTTEKEVHLKYLELEAMGHYSSGPFRGHKSDIWEGGHRVPCLVRWPAQIKAGSSSDQLFSLVDFMATCAEIVHAEIPSNAAEDSVSILPLLLGKSTSVAQKAIVYHSFQGALAIQQGQWKLEFCQGSGGWGKGGVTDAPGQLYDMSKDIGEQTNLYHQNPEVVSQLTKLMEKYIEEGRSTPGPKASNDGEVRLWKKGGDKKSGSHEGDG